MNTYTLFEELLNLQQDYRQEIEAIGPILNSFEVRSYLNPLYGVTQTKVTNFESSTHVFDSPFIQQDEDYINGLDNISLSRSGSFSATLSTTPASDNHHEKLETTSNSIAEPTISRINEESSTIKEVKNSYKRRLQKQVSDFCCQVLRKAAKQKGLGKLEDQINHNRQNRKSKLYFFQFLTLIAKKIDSELIGSFENSFNVFLKEKVQTLYKKGNEKDFIQLASRQMKLIEEAMKIYLRGDAQGGLQKAYGQCHHRSARALKVAMQTIGI